MAVPTVTGTSWNSTGSELTITFSEPVTGTLGFRVKRGPEDALIFSEKMVYGDALGSGDTRVISFGTRGPLRGEEIYLSYDTTTGNILSVSTSDELGAFTDELITNNISKLNTVLRRDNFDVFLDIGCQNPPSPHSTAFQKVYDPGQVITFTYPGGVATPTFEYDKIDAAVDFAYESGAALLFDNENHPSGTFPMDNRVYTNTYVEVARQSLITLYEYCKERHPEVLVGHYGYPTMNEPDFWSVILYLEEYVNRDKIPSNHDGIDYLTNYNNWLAAMDRMNQYWNGSTLVADPWVWSDFLSPTIYSQYDHIGQNALYNREHLKATYEKFSQNGTIPIYPHIWWDYHSDPVGFHISGYYMRQIMKTCREYADGFILWSGGIGRARSIYYSTSATLGDWQAITDGSIKLLWEQQPVEITGLNFSGVSNATTDVATVITNAINAAKPTQPTVYSVHGQNDMIADTGYQLPTQSDVAVVWYDPWSDALVPPGKNRFIFTHTNAYSKLICNRSRTEYTISGTPASGTNIGVSPYLVEDTTFYDGYLYGEYPPVSSNGDFAYPYNEFDLYIEPSDWWAAIEDVMTKQTEYLPTEDAYVRSLKPMCWIRMPSTVSHGDIVLDKTGFGHDFTYIDQQYLTLASSTNYVDADPSDIISSVSARADSNAITFKGNRKATNTINTSNFSNGGFLHYGRSGSIGGDWGWFGRRSAILHASEAWTVSFWFKPSDVPVTDGSVTSYIIACGADLSVATGKYKGATFIYDTTGGPKFFWHDTRKSTNSTYQTLPLNTSFSANQWYLITVRFRESDLSWTASVNDTVDNVVTLPAQISARTYRWIENYFSINAGHSIVSSANGGAVGRSNHTVGDFLAWTRYLSDDEIRKMYHTVSSRYNKHSGIVCAV